VRCPIIVAPMGSWPKRFLFAVVLVAALTAPVASAQAAIGATPVLSASWPAAFAFDPSQRIFYGTRLAGQIRIFDPGTRTDTLFFTLPDVANVGEQGLLGLALHPRYPTRPYVYAFYTRTVNGSPQNQIVRLTDAMGIGQDLKTLVRLPAAIGHNGGVIHFGPDRRLYAVVGENGDRANAQDLATPAGKVLRMSATGRPLRGNPFPGSRVWSYGLRNSFGFTFDPETRELWETENGPECNDELNRIVKGGNYAWGPNETCTGGAPANTNQDGPLPRIFPAAFFGQVIAPTGATFCEGCGLGPMLEGRLVFGDWDNQDIHAATLTPDRLGIASQTVILHRAQGILAVERSPGGSVYFSDLSGIFRLTGP
jgi:glucose/arabinose dehydrogenase